jgi:cytochrome c oxidase assembly protein subunit 11
VRIHPEARSAKGSPLTARAADRDLRADNRALLFKLGVVAVAMFGFGFLLVPFYEKICEATGIRNIDAADAPRSTQVDYARTLRVELDANTRGLPWTFRAATPVVDVHPGQLTEVVYEVVNNTDRPVTGQAIPSYGPQYAAQYFRKLECFCFTQQTLAPGERRQMPVVFVIDPAVPKDLATITLSYTFFVVEGAAKG